MTLSLASVAQVAAGYYSTCARQTSGNVLCWGEDQFGELGDGKGINVTTPQLVPGLTSSTSIVGGVETYCSMGTDLCWGDNSSAQLGNGTYADAYLPVRVSL